MPRDLLTIPEAAETLDLSVVRVRQLIKAEKLRAERYGSVWLVPRGEIETFRKIPRPVGRPMGWRKAPT